MRVVGQKRIGGGERGLFYVRRHTCADGSFEWYVLNGHTRRRASKSGGCSGAEEVAGEARPSQGASPQANAERVRREADKGGAGRGVKTNKAGKGRKFPHPVMAITAGTSQGELIHTQN